MNKQKISNQQGYVALILVLVMLTLGLAIGIITSLKSLTQMSLAWQNYQNLKTQALADTCAGEALLELSRQQSAYLGTHNLNYAADSCIVQVNSEGTDYTLQITAEHAEKYYKKINIITALPPDVRSEWSEVANF